MIALKVGFLSWFSLWAFLVMPFEQRKPGGSLRWHCEEEVHGLCGHGPH